tara:strand:- start:185 stop:379 length:195 start_codon:yes stop_codon:yes gene_type:complete
MCIKVKVGDKVRMLNVRNPKIIDKTVYTVVEIIEKSVKLKHPNVAGHFTFLKKNIVEVVNEVVS